MRLDEILRLRPTVCAGALVCLTERCPLSCAHCSSSSTLSGRVLDRVALLAFIGSFDRDCRPELLMLTGGEPLMRPRLVIEAAEAARAAGTRTAVLSGAFFASGGELPAPVRDAARAVDHLSLSLDVFHERQIARDDVFAALAALLRLGVATSLHMVSRGAHDPYPDEVAAQVRSRFGDEVPMLVAQLRPIGRGADLLAGAAPRTPPDPLAVSPCAMAAWPVVAADGEITACCNQDVVDGRARPAHLVVGRAGETGWPAVRERMQRSTMLRAIRIVGPTYLAAAEQAGGGDGKPCVGGYCDACHRLGDRPEPGRLAERIGGAAVGELLEATVIKAAESAGPAELVRRYGSARHAHLVAERASEAAA